MPGFATCADEFASSVYPSGAESTTTLEPIEPPAPTRFSATTGWPHISCSLAATARPMMSVELPGVNAMTSRTGLAGYACARQAPARIESATKATALRKPIRDLHIFRCELKTRAFRLLQQ